MHYTAYLASAQHRLVLTVDRTSAAVNQELLSAFLLHVRADVGDAQFTVAAGGERIINVQFTRNAASALFILTWEDSVTLLVQAQSGYITGMTNSADRDMFKRLQQIVGHPGWEPDVRGVTVLPPCYYIILLPPTKLDPDQAKNLLLERMAVGEAAAIAFFYLLRLDGPHAYEWEEPDN